MGKWHYYNEFEPFAAEWLRNLIRKGLIPDGEVDTRSIVDVGPDDVGEFVQCHYFAGIAGWPLALKFAGWPEDRPVWTGSCPCQPFSVAGKGKGTDDERHLWPAFFRLIRECRPSIVFGEQVSGKAGYGWFDGVASDLEREDYACGAVDIPACAVNAPHIRQRLYWVATDMANADSWDGKPLQSKRPAGIRNQAEGQGANAVVGFGCGSGDMADSESIGRRGWAHNEDEGRREQPSADTCTGGGDMANSEGQREPSGSDECSINSGCRFIVDGAEPWSDGLNDGKSVFGNVANSDDARRQGWAVHAECSDELSPWSRGVEWRRGADGKERRVKSGAALLVNGISGGVAMERTLPGGEKETHIYSRVGALRGFGNAIVPQLAAEFIKVFISHSD